MVCCQQMSQDVEIVSNLGPNIFWLKVRTHRLPTLTFVRTFSQFTSNYTLNPNLLYNTCCCQSYKEQIPVRFSLQDIKKQVHRRGNTLSVSMHFLHPGELRGEIERLVSYHEQLLGHPQRDFSIEDARACIGDYRLAHCLITTLSEWYSWQQHEWQMAVHTIGNYILVRFQEAKRTSPVHLRLALFSFVNERYDGLLDAQTRIAALEEFAEMYCGKDQQGELALPIADLEYLLALDSDEEAVLVRDTPHPPDADEVASLYNQWVFEAALFNASDVHFAIDCTAFIKMQDTSTNKTMTGVGAVIKRLCYLSLKLGEYYTLVIDST